MFYLKKKKTYKKLYFLCYIQDRNRKEQAYFCANY